MAQLLTEKQIAEYKEAFAVFDRDGDGHITTEELGAFMTSLGQEPSQSELQDIINEIDTGNDGSIEFDEFIAMMAMRSQAVDTEQEIFEAFKVFDRDQNGFICATELQGIMKAVGEDLTDNEIYEMIRQVDKDGDGKINYEEFVELIRQN